MSNYSVEAQLIASGGAQFVQAFRDAENAVASLEGVGKQLTSIGGDLTKKVTAPILGLAAGAIKVGSDFDTSMSKVEAISGATGKELEKLEATAREMGATTRYSASESADALGYMALAGWDSNQMISALPDVLNLATAGSLDLATASDIVTDMMSMFGMEADEASRATDIFSRAQANSNTSVEQLSSALTNAGPAASAAGASMEDTAAILGILANQGLKGSAAGTAVNAMYRDMQAAAEDGAIAIGDHNVAIYDSEGNMRSMADIMKDVEGATSDMTDEQRNAALAQIFQQQSLRGVNMLLNEGTGSLFDLKGALENSAGSAQEMADIMDNNAAGALLSLWSAVQEVGIAFWQIIRGPFIAFIEALTNIVRWIGQLSPPIQIAIVVIAALAAAVGPVLIGIGLLIQLIAAAVKGFLLLKGSIAVVTGAFFKIALPILAVIAVLVALGAAFYHLMQTNEEFRARVMAIWETIKAYMTTVVQTIATVVMAIWGALVDFWNTHSETMLNVALIVWNAILTAIEVALSVIATVVMSVWSAVSNFWNTHSQQILNIASIVWSTILTVIQTTISVIAGVIMAIWGGILQFWDYSGQWILQVIVFAFGAVYNAVSTFISAAADIIMTIWGHVTAFWSQHGEMIMSATQIVFGGIFATIAGFMTIIVGTISSALSIITALFNVVWPLIKMIVEVALSMILFIVGVFAALLTGDWEAMWNIVQETAERILGAIWDGVTGFFTAIWDAISTVFGWIGEKMGLVETEVSESAESMANNVSDSTEKMSTNANSNTENMKTSTSSNAQQMETNVSNSASNMATNTSGDIQGMSFDAILSANNMNAGVSGQADAMSGSVVGSVAGMNSNTNVDFGNMQAFGLDSASALNSGVSGDITDMFNSTTGDVSSMTDSIDIDLSTMSDSGIDAASLLNDGVTTDVSNMNTEATGDVSDMLSQITGDFDSMESDATKSSSNMNKSVSNDMKAMSKVGQQSAKQMQQAVMSAFRAMQQAATSAMSAMTASVRSGGMAMLSSIRSTLSSAVAAMRGAIGQFRSAGAFLMQGFRAGIMSQAGSVMSAASSIANRAAATIRSALKIKSPSRVMMEVGEFFTDGVAVGILDGENGLVKNVEHMANEMQNAFNPQLDYATSFSNALNRAGNLPNNFNHQHSIGESSTPVVRVDNKFEINGTEYKSFVSDIANEITKQQNSRNSYGGAL